MKDTEYAFAVAKIRANENNLIKASALDSAIVAETFKDAIKIFVDAGFSELDEYDVDTALSYRMRRAFNLIYDAAPDKKCLDFLIVKNDFHNLKALLKGLVANVDTGNFLLLPTVNDVDTLKKAVNEKKFDLLSPVFRIAVKEAYDVLTETLDGQSCEAILDRACLETSVLLAKDLGDEFAIKFCERLALLTNFKICLRAIKTGKDEKFYKSAVADVCDKQKLIDKALDGIESFKEYVSFCGYGDLAEAVDVSYAAFEKLIDDRMLECVNNAKFTSFGISPLVAYYFASDSETKNVRIVLSCKKNGISSEIIRERVRKLYV